MMMAIMRVMITMRLMLIMLTIKIMNNNSIFGYIASLNAMRIQISFVVAYDFNQLIYAI